MADFNYFESDYKKESYRQTAIPPSYMWDKIEASLNAQGKKRALVWYWVAAAAGVAVLFTLGVHHLSTTSVIEDDLLVTTVNNSKHNTQSVTDVLKAQESAKKEKDKNQNQELGYKAESETELGAGAEPLQLLATKEPLDKEKTIYFNQSLIRKDFKSEEKILDIHKGKSPLIAYSSDTPKYLDSKISNVKTESPKNNNWLEKYNVEADHNNQNINRREKPTRVQIAGSLSPSYSFRNISQTAQANIPSNPNSEEGIITLAAAIDLNIKVHKNWAVESGLRFSRMGQQVHTNSYSESMFALAAGKEGARPQVVNKISLANSMGDVNTKVKSNSKQNLVNAMDFAATSKVVGFESASRDIQSELEQRIDYLEVPITFRFYVPTKGEVKLSLAGGISTNWLIDNNAYLSTDGEKQLLGATEGISSMTWSSHAGVAISVPISGHLSFKFEPRVSYFLTDINPNHPIGYKPFSFGLFSGVQYTISK